MIDFNIAKKRQVLQMLTPNTQKVKKVISRKQHVDREVKRQLQELWRVAVFPKATV